jgi:hypothetical protein
VGRGERGCGPFESIECVGSEALGLSKTSNCALSEITRVAPAFKFFVTSWTIGLMNGYVNTAYKKPYLQ